MRTVPRWHLCYDCRDGAWIEPGGDLVKYDDHAGAIRDVIEECAKICDHAVRYNTLKCKQALKHKRQDIADGHQTAMDMARECAREIRSLILPKPPTTTETTDGR